MRKIAVFGANGNLGHHVVEAFCSAGWHVIAISRDGKYNFGDKVETRAADAMNEAQVIAASEGCDTIFNGLNPVYTQWEQMCMPMASHIIAAAATHKATHLFAGNVYNYGSSIPEFFDENTPENADTKKGAIRVEMEKMFTRKSKELGVQTIVLRAGDFIGGPATTPLWFNLAITKKLQKGIFTYPGPMDQVHSWAYLPDLANTFVRLAEYADQMDDFQTFNFQGYAITGAQLKQALEKVAGRTLKQRGMPWPLLRIAALISPMMREVVEMAYLWDVPHRMDETKLISAIGSVPHTQIHDAIVKSLQNAGKKLPNAEPVSPALVAANGQ